MKLPIARAKTAFLSISAVLASLVCTPAARAAEVSGGWAGWWLPPDHSEHGGEIDILFNWIFWLTTIIMIVVFIVMACFLIKYRHDPRKKKAHFTHGNSRLEMAWTIAPAIILALLALFSKKVWDNYRYGPHTEDPGKCQVLVIGEQFKWNIIYPGKDGKLGRYLVYPRPTDEKWSDPRPADEKKGTFFWPRQGIAGPAQLPYPEAIAAINSYITTHNKLGKDFDDPEGKDDNWVADPGRELVLPKGRPIEVQLSAKDVIHDFFLPNFRVKLDAVPGMRGKIHFVSKMSSTEREKLSRREMTFDEIEARFADDKMVDMRISIAEGMTGADKDKTGWRYADVKNAKDPKKPSTIIRDGAAIQSDAAKRAELFKKLKDNGIAKVMAYESGTWELVCEELCGANHYTMRGEVRILEQDDFDKLGFDMPYAQKRAEGMKAAPAVAAGISH